MADKNHKFSYQSLQDCESIVAHLNALAEGLSRGSLSLVSDGRELELRPRGLLSLNLKATQGAYRSSLMLKVSWREDPPGHDQQPVTLDIRPGAPKE